MAKEVFCLNKQDYQIRKLERLQGETKYRHLCTTCLQPEFGCYCSKLQRFDPKIKFVILIHPIEAKRRIATGRMSYLSLENAEIIKGQDYSLNSRVNEILADPGFSTAILYPGRNSTNISNFSADDFKAKPIFKAGKIPVIFVIDGTWATAIKTLAQSKNLASVPQFCFTPERLSQFRVRKQPAKECVSTIEAIHQTIEMLGPSVGFSALERTHDSLLHVFDYMVERQLEFIRLAAESPHFSTYRRPRLRVS